MSDAPPGRGVSRRPETTEDDAEPVDAGRETDGLNGITLRPGARRTGDLQNLKIEAKMVADGHEPDNPWIPIADSGVVEEFIDWADGTEYEPAWLRPWEGDDE